MRIWFLIGTPFLVLFFSAVAFGDDLEKEMQKLQGTWVPVRAERYGFTLESEIKDLTVVISGEKLTFKWPNKEVPMSFVLGSTDEHKTIDTTNLDGPLKGFVNLGIYSCEDNLLALCMSTNRKPERPKTFSTARTPMPGRSLYIFQRPQP